MANWIIVDHVKDGASAIAKRRFLSALDKAGIAYEIKIMHTGAFDGRAVILAQNNDPMVYNLADKTAAAPESIQIFSAGKAVIISGSDERGLAYAVMEMTERVEAYGERALLELKPESNSPTAIVRGMDKLVCNTDDDAWWMSEDYWRYRLESMLAARYNRLVLLVGFDTSYLSPPYPYFVDVPEYPGVTVNDPDFDRSRHLAALRRLGSLVHEYGMEFVFATWQQSNWLVSQTSKVEGIEDLTAYCSAGIRELALQCPEMDMIQLRVNHEAGVGTQITAEEYWFKQLDGLAEAKKRGSRIKLDLRAKGLTDHMIRYAKELGLDLTVSTKYWCEQAGLPYHLTRMRTEELTRLDNFNHSRRYSYADMLKKPRLHKLVYRLWNDGSTDLFTWGDPDYVRRFVTSLELGKADGFEIMPMLSLKGGPEDGKVTGWSIFDDPAYRPEGYEDSRYWLCDRLFGRLGYDIDEADEAWMRPMRLRFGGAAEPIMAAIAAASRLIPFVVGYHMPVHPQLYYWAEFSTGGALFVENNHNPAIKKAGVTYQNAEPGDAGLFYPIDEFAKAALSSGEDGRYTPWQVAGTLRDIASNAQKFLADAEKAGMPDTSEARGAALDVRMLIELARYHRLKIAASVNLCLYGESKDKAYLACSLAAMRGARDHWAAFAELGQKYHSRLVFYVGDPSVCRDGNWKDFYPELDADIARLKKMLGGDAAENASLPEATIAAVDWRDNVPDCCPAGKPLSVTLRTNGRDAFRGAVNLRYRHTNQMEGSFISAPMMLRDGAWSAEIPAAYITPEWDLLLYFEAVGLNGDGLVYPGLWNSGSMLPYHIVEVE